MAARSEAEASSASSDMAKGHVRCARGLKPQPLGWGVGSLFIVVMMLANSWSTFMMSPAGVDAQGYFLGNYWHVLHNALWNPFNVHRFFGNIVSSSAVIGAYAAFQAMKGKTDDEKAYYDWASYVAFLTAVFALFIVPFGGYRLLIEIYGYRPQMGIILLGGLLSELKVVFVLLFGILFIVINYYIWRRIDSAGATDRYGHYAKYVFLVLAVCLLVYITPHYLVMNASEFKAIGGLHHPLVGNFGVDSAKQPAVNIMLVVTFWSLLLLRWSKYQSTKTASRIGNALLLGLFIAGSLNIVWLGIYGYYIPANVRVGLKVPMVMSSLSILVLSLLFTYRNVSKVHAESLIPWGRLSIRGYLALLFMAVTLTWIMGLLGYARSSARLFWHATEIFRDNSPWAFTHTIGFAGNVITLNALLFWGTLLIIIWLARIYSKGTQG